MSDAHRDDIADIRRELWLLYASLKAGETDPEVGDTMINTLDSIADLTRLERELRSGPDAAVEADRDERPMRRKP